MPSALIEKLDKLIDGFDKKANEKTWTIPESHEASSLTPEVVSKMIQQALENGPPVHAPAMDK